jgi:hypothetical protein
LASVIVHLLAAVVSLHEWETTVEPCMAFSPATMATLIMSPYKFH